MSKSKRKKKSKSNMQRRKFLGARIEFDGNEDNYQIAEFANGGDLNSLDVKNLIRFEFKFDIFCSLIYKNEFGFLRTKEIKFKTAQPVRFNSLKTFVDEMATITGLEMPEGYHFHKNTWRAYIVG